MASNNDNVEEKMTFKWTDEYERIFCELCIKFIKKNGRVSFKWKEINQEFETIIKRKCLYKTLKNKYDSMKKDFRIWKFLKFEEIGLGWDPVMGKLSGANDWWDRKIKEKPEAKKFYNKSIDPSVEEYWNQLFEDNYATGANVVTPSMDPELVQPVEHVNVEEGEKESGEEGNHYYESDGDYIYSEYNRYASRIDDNSFWPDFMHELGGTQVPSQGLGGTQAPNQGHGGTQAPSSGEGIGKIAQPQKMTNKPIKGKHKRHSGGATKVGGQIEHLVSNSDRALEIIVLDGSVTKHDNGPYSIAAAMAVIKQMVTEGDLEDGGELWCFEACLFEDDRRREIFLNMDTNQQKKAWLIYMHANRK